MSNSSELRPTNVSRGGEKFLGRAWPPCSFLVTGLGSTVTSVLETHSLNARLVSLLINCDRFTCRHLCGL